MVAGPHKSQEGKKKNKMLYEEEQGSCLHGLIWEGFLKNQEKPMMGTAKARAFQRNCSSRARGEKDLQGFWHICEVASELLRLGPGECCQTQGREAAFHLPS